jgi:formylglycine-generating enzyme
MWIFIPLLGFIVALYVDSRSSEATAKPDSQDAAFSDDGSLQSGRRWTRLPHANKQWGVGQLHSPDRRELRACVVADATSTEATLVAHSRVVLESDRSPGLLGSAQEEEDIFWLQKVTGGQEMVIDGADMVLSDQCRDFLVRMRRSGTDLQDWRVVSEVISATVMERRCEGEEALAEARAAEASGEIGDISNCAAPQTSDGVIAYRSMSALELLGEAVLDGGEGLGPKARPGMVRRPDLASGDDWGKGSIFWVSGPVAEQAIADCVVRRQEGMLVESARDWTLLQGFHADTRSGEADLAEAVEQSMKFVEGYTGRRALCYVGGLSAEHKFTAPEVAKAKAWLFANGVGSGTNKTGIALVLIEPSSFTMGCPPGPGECQPIDLPPKVVPLTQPFFLGATEVTQGQWLDVMGTEPSEFSTCGPECPVESVDWFQAVKFANALSKLEGLSAVYTIRGNSVKWDRSASGYRLPTEEEWEYAARAGEDTLYSGSEKLGEVSWYQANAEGRTHSVGQLKANALGLYDMSGNVWEWVWDRHARAERLHRGGSWKLPSLFERVYSRGHWEPKKKDNTIGFRIARTVPGARPLR